MRYDIGIFVGRFQPFHSAHFKELQRTLSLAEKVLVIIGSHRSAKTPRDPFSTDEREQMIRSCLSEQENSMVYFAFARDYIYNNTQWFSDVTRLVENFVNEQNLDRKASLCLTGCNKDESQSYIASFPDNWTREIIKSPQRNVHSTDIREQLFSGTTPQKIKNIPAGVVHFLSDYITTQNFKLIQSEHQFYKNYKKAFDDLPYPPVFVTTDAVVIKNGHILVVERKSNPGKGMLALPGGHLDLNKPILASCIKELKEETKIEVNKDYLKSIASHEKVFDAPERSLRGRTITHGYCFKLPDGGKLPNVNAGDDAAKAFWMPIMEAYERCDEFFEDHIHIINYYTRRF